MKEFEVTRPWNGLGKIAAEQHEKKQIALRLDQGCLLTNRQHGDRNITVEMIVDWLCG
jgi:uncharacterized protein (DUF4415 family)